ncbi:MAG: cation-translocating P-type ATPase [Abditibacteriota bacterium]|nr:cation-translocating P-type ATPase [Abditibacteriota bacterium]
MNEELKGLSPEEVEASRQKYGTNRIETAPSKTFLQAVWETVKGDAMIDILLVAFILETVFAFLHLVEFYEPIGIFVAVVLAVLLGTLSEFSAENQFRRLQNEASKISVKVRRGGELKEIPVDDIVRGDLVVLESGDKIPADGYLAAGSLSADLAALNGENEPCRKEVFPGDVNWDRSWDSNEYDVDGSVLLNPYKLHRGSVVCEGAGVMKVHKISRETLMGSAADSLANEEKSPLNLKLEKLAGYIARYGYILAVVIAVIYMLATIFDYTMDKNLHFATYFSAANGGRVIADLVKACLLAVTIVVVAVPEGLPLMTMLVLSLNMKKLLSSNVLVRKLAGIETAGALNVLYSDKTGTITRGRLEVVSFFDGTGRDYTLFEDIPQGLRDLLTLSINSNTSSQVSEDGGEVKVIGGNLTEKALALWAWRQKVEVPVEKKAAILFDSSYKFSAQEVTVGGSRDMVLLKGAPEVLSGCAYYFDEGADPQPLSGGKREELIRKIDNLASRQIRVIAVAICLDRPETLSCEELLKKEMVLLGYIAIRDEIRPSSMTAVRELKEAGVQVVMITGDRRETAQAIAAECGILAGEEDVVLTSNDLAAMSDEEVMAVIPRLRVVARALPGDKYRLMELTQRLGLVAAMTGDGVNDAPALTRADVGFGVGSGTETAKEAADIVILDDNIHSITKAVLYGRTIFNSIRRFIVFQLTVNVSAVLINLICPVMVPFVGDRLEKIITSPLTVTQMLWVNLVMDTLAAVAFGTEPALKKFMKDRPVPKKESIITRSMGASILFGGLYLTLVSMAFLGTGVFARLIFGAAAPGPDRLLTAYFTFYIFTILFNMFNARTEGLKIFANIGKNPGFIGVFLGISLIQLAMTYWGGHIFRCFGLSFPELAKTLALAFMIIPADLLRKRLCGCGDK